MPVSPSALTAAYDRLTSALPGLRVQELPPGAAQPDGGGWITAASLTGPGEAMDAFLAWDDAQIRRDHGTRARPDVTASFGLHRYAWPVCLLITVPWLLLRRVPRLPVTHVSYDRTVPDLAMGRLAVRAAGFACLPGDPAAVLPGARVVADEEALRAEVRAAVAGHLEPVLAAFGPRMRRRGRALWGMATDEVVEGLWYVAGLLGEEERATAELKRLLPGATLPFVGSAGFRELSTPSGARLATRDRASCCMFYTLHPEDTCATCPRTCDADRIVKLTARTAA
ncbi:MULTISPECIES: (2Fe-2S)-binding protein [Streptomyces]|uniref:(2Fe-2S)-binding protein n=1 Tax=Streptomyces doudnae TaxID=3075536 RepID=A0ABD5EXW2_9ACTN|nr:MULTISPECIES: (2Fe-2S)-binding protein [unclassified Streptomyces]MDT0439606.1 (2Fe-2S)-binding protein [Streptomyces sp. DSM 41981]MYQ65628.1 iron-sulfur protein [Streptomyces sp. SID4950]SCE04181.1 FhuF 2Fe-2S C-terminal domain-containing protein [Streptomyces sp. SolWspMP-5a-2]